MEHFLRVFFAAIDPADEHGLLLLVVWLVYEYAPQLIDVADAQIHLSVFDQKPDVV